MIPLRDLNPSSRTPLVTIAILTACVLVYLLEPSDPRGVEAFVHTFGIVPRDLHATVTGMAGSHGATGGGLLSVLSLLTSLFLHGGFVHLAGNLWFLWLFGDNVEDRLGHGRFLLFYLACGLAAGIVHVALHPASDLPTIGASGAIAGVLGAYLVSFPRARVLALLPIGFFLIFRELPAWVFLGLWFLLQILAAGGGDVIGGIAYGAHVGGFLAGIVLVLILPAARGRGRGRRTSRRT